MTTEISIDNPKETLSLHPTAFSTKHGNGDDSICRDFYQEIAFLLQVELTEVSVSCGQKWAGHFRDSEGRMFVIRPQWNDNKLEISGDWPRHKTDAYAATTYSGENNPSIGVGASRKSGEIAREIKRRFFPDFHERWKQVAERVRRTDKYHDDRQTNRQLFASLIDGAETEDRDSELLYAPSPYHRLQMSADSVTITLHGIPIELGKQIVSVVEAYRKKHPDTE